MSTNKYKQGAKLKKLPLQERFDEVLQAFNRSNNYVTSHYREKWANNTKLYNNERVDVQYLGSSEIFIPETFTILQTIKSHMLGGDPTIEFMPTRADQLADTKVLTKMVDFIWEADNMDLTLDLCADDMLAIGNSYAVTFWDPIKKIPTTKYFHAQDMFFDMSSGTYEGMRYFGFRYLTTKKELEDAYIINPDYNPGETGSETLIKRYKNLSEVKPLAGYSSDNLAKAEKEAMLVGAQYHDPDMVEAICYISKERMITLINRRVVIEDAETPFQRKEQQIQSVDNIGNPVPIVIPAIAPFLPFAPFRDYIDGNLWYARGEIDIIKDLQERLNDVKTQKFDNLSFLLNKMFTLDPTYGDRINEVVSSPGAVLTFPSGALDEIATTPIGPDADNEASTIMDAMRRATAADELVQGVGQDRGMMTAEEVRAQIAQAGTRFARKLKQVSKEGLRIWADNVFKLIQIYVDQEIAIRMVGPSGIEWQNYNPGEYLGDFTPRVMLEAEAKAIKEEEKQNAMQFFLMSSKMPFIDLQKLWITTGTTIFNKDAEELQNMLVQPQMSVDPKTGQPMPQNPSLMPIDNSVSGGLPAAEGMQTDPQQMNMAGMPTA